MRFKTLAALSIIQCWLRPASPQVSTQHAFINEVHYTNIWTDRNEFVEVAVIISAVTGTPAESSIGGLTLYDGSTGASYKNVSLSDASTIVNGEAVTYIVWDIDGILDKPPHGIALHDATGSLVEFLSYGGGSFKAVDGVATGQISNDIGYEQHESNDAQISLQRIGIGAADSVSGGRWVLADHTRGAANVLQTFDECTPVANKDAIQLNEIHYDDFSTDSGQFVEFMFRDDEGISPASIGGLILYDGATGTSTLALSINDAFFFYDSDDSSIGFIVWEDIDLDDGPDGFAIVDNCNSVLQFLSYGGSFLAQEGLAENLVSNDIKYTQPGNTAAGISLQRIGIGFDQTVSDNNWVLGTHTRGKANILQTFGTCNSIADPSAIQINELHYDDIGSDQDEFVEFLFRRDGGVSPSSIGGLVLYSGDGVSSMAFSLADGTLTFDKNDANFGFLVWSTPLTDNGPAGFALVDHCNNVVQFNSYEGSFRATEGIARNSVSVDIGYSQTFPYYSEYSLQRIGIGFEETRTNNDWVLTKKTKSEPNRFQTLASCRAITNTNSIQFNEVHYNDWSTDSGEFIEFAFLTEEVSAENVAGIVLYGADGISYLALPVETEPPALFVDQDDPGIGFVVWNVDSLPDETLGIALVDGCNNVVQFVSYGGVVTATEGLAAGLVSVDIGYSETGQGSAEESLQRQSCENGDLNSTQWVVAASTNGARNFDQDVRSCLDVQATPAPTPIPTPAPISVQVLESPPGPRHSQGIIAAPEFGSTANGTAAGFVTFANDLVVPSTGGFDGGVPAGTQTGHCVQVWDQTQLACYLNFDLEDGRILAEALFDLVNYPNADVVITGGSGKYLGIVGSGTTRAPEDFDGTTFFYDFEYKILGDDDDDDSED